MQSYKFPVTIQPLPLKLALAGTPSRDPEFSIPVKTRSFGEIKVADPKASRAMIALMDMQAVQGGAASHIGQRVLVRFEQGHAPLLVQAARAGQQLLLRHFNPAG